MTAPILGSMDVPSEGRRHRGAAGPFVAPWRGSGGYSLLEMLAVLVVLLIFLAGTLPRGRAYLYEQRLRGAAHYVRSLVRQVRARAVAEGRYVGVVFDEADGDPVFSVYADGNGNGIRRADIDRGADVKIREPYRLSETFPGVGYGHVPAGGGGPQFPGLRIGRSKIVSCSPIGACTPGTLFLSNGDVVYAIVILGATGRVRLARYAGGEWQAQ